eukprot:1150931-Pelagomonas_calceolata.AAC.1
MSNAPGNLALVRSLVDHPAFNINNPNNCYSLFLAFARWHCVNLCSAYPSNCLNALTVVLHRSPVNFHAADGSGYAFMGDSVLRVDKINHQAFRQSFRQSAACRCGELGEGAEKPH